MSVVCQFVKPVSDRYIHLAPALRTCWTAEALARKHQDLLEWRDALYASDRVRRGAAEGCDLRHGTP